MTPLFVCIAVFTALFVIASAADSNKLLVQQQLNSTNWTTTTWPSLKFHFTLKRSSIHVYGHENFDMVAYPVLLNDKAKVLYDVFATFTKDSSVYNYTLVNGVAYQSTAELEESSVKTPVVECLESESHILPPINAIVTALNEATPISNTESDNACTSGSSFKASVRGVNFAVCALGSSSFTMKSSDMDIAVGYLSDQEEIGAHKVPLTMVKSNCSAVASPSLISRVGEAFLTGKTNQPGDSRALKAAVDFSWGDSSCSCKSTPRPCIFVHGLGVKIEDPENRDSFDDYWGSEIVNHAPCCSSMKFVVLDTENNAWTNASLQEKVCERILSVSNSSVGSKIADTIVVTHSMGNLMLAGAIATKTCTLHTSTTWVGLAGPMLGSMASDFVQDSCTDKSTAMIESYADLIGICPVKPAIKSLSNENGNYRPGKLNAAFSAAQKVYRAHVSALMCSVSVSGLFSIYNAKFWLMHNLVAYKSKENDGMVEFESCAGGFPASKFGDTWQSQFYRTKLNHYDMTFRQGDAMFDKSKMPVKWFECLL